MLSARNGSMTVTILSSSWIRIEFVTLSIFHCLRLGFNGHVKAPCKFLSSPQYDLLIGLISAKSWPVYQKTLSEVNEMKIPLVVLLFRIENLVMGGFLKFTRNP